MKPLLNRNFTLPPDGFYQVVPRGEWPVTLDVDQARQIKGYPVATLPAAGYVRVIQVVDEAACAAMMNRFAEIEATPNFAGMLWDYDHFSNDTNKSSEAIAWGLKMENRADGLYQSIRFAGDGETKIKTGAFRFPSPVWNPSDCEWIGNGRVRPLRLDRVAATNDPNMKGIKPLSNRAGDSGVTNPGDAGTKGGSTMDYKTELLAMLGLPADATDDQIAAAKAEKACDMENACKERDAMKNRAETAEGKVKDFEAKALEAQVEKDLSQHADVIANREEVKGQLLANREGTLKTLRALKKPVTTGPAALRNRDAHEPATDPAAGEVVKNREMFIEELRVKNRLSHSQAHSLAATLKPELFK